MNRKKVYRILYLFFIIAFLMILVNMNSVILWGIDSSDKFVKCKSISEGNSDVYVSISMETYDDLLETVIFNGWAFCETTEENSSKTYDIILKNASNMYYVQSKASVRDDVQRVFSDKAVYSDLNGIEVGASTIGVKDGIYNVYLFVKENEKNSGIIDTGLVIRKGKDSLEEYKYALVEEPLNVEISQQIKKDVDIKREGNSWIISGWCFALDRDTCNQKVLVRIKSNTEQKAYYAKKGIRPDVAKSYNDDRYMYSGFRLELEQWENADSYAICVWHENECLSTDWIPIND